MPAPRDDPHDRGDKTRRHPGTGRLPALTTGNLDPSQQVFYDSMVANEVPWAEHGGARAIAEDGSLLGPFNPLLFSPAISAAMLGVFRADSANTTLDSRSHEIVILTVGAACHANYELYAHRAIGHAAGLPDTVITAIIAGERPEFDSNMEASAYDFTHELTHTHRVGDATYAKAVDAFGETGIVDMVMLIGLYLTVSAIVNAFEIPVPEDSNHPTDAPPPAVGTTRRQRTGSIAVPSGPARKRATSAR
jgi:4-carboxymuconolactone decarboxylase